MHRVCELLSIVNVNACFGNKDFVAQERIPNSQRMTKNKRPGGFLCKIEPDNLQWVHEFPRSAKMMCDAG